jgi:hypothetical protein
MFEIAAGKVVWLVWRAFGTAQSFDNSPAVGSAVIAISM